MDNGSADIPRDVDFEWARDDNLDEGASETFPDGDRHEACVAGLDLQEIGLHGLNAWAVWRVLRVARPLFDEYRAARSAVDMGRPGADKRLEVARSGLYAAALGALEGFPGWTAPEGGQP